MGGNCQMRFKFFNKKKKLEKNVDFNQSQTNKLSKKKKFTTTQNQNRPNNIKQPNQTQEQGIIFEYLEKKNLLTNRLCN